MRNTKRFTSLAAVAMLGLMVAACGSDGAASDATDAPAATGATGATTAPDATTAPAGTTAPDGSAAPAASGPKVGLVFDIGGRGDQSFNDSAAAGIERATERTRHHLHRGIAQRRWIESQELLDLAAESSDIVIAVGFLFEADAAAVGKSNPDKTFGVVDSTMQDFTTDPSGAHRTAPTSPVWCSPRSKVRSSLVPQRR